MTIYNYRSLIALCVGFFMVIIDVNIVNVALPSMAKNLGGDIAWLQWVVDGYTLTFACLLLSAGNLGDRFDAKKVYLLGLALFILTSWIGGIAINFFMLTTFRLLQGASAALLVPTSLTLINASYENRRDQMRAIGVWASVGGFAAASGPVLGAFLTAWFGWRAVFLVNIPIGIIGILLTIRYVDSKISADNKSSLDFFGQIVGIISMASLAFCLIEAGKLGWFSDMAFISISIFIVTFFIFIKIEQHTISPMFPLKFFKSKTFSASTAVGMIINLGYYGLLFLLPLYFQNIKGYSIFVTGLAIAPLSALSAVCSYFSGRLSSVIGFKIIMIIGLIIAATGYFAMLIVGEHTSYILLLLPLLLLGIGGSLTMPAATIAVINSAPEGRTGIASGAFNTSRQIGSLIGVSVFGAIINASANFISGMHATLIICGSIFILGCLITLIWID